MSKELSPVEIAAALESMGLPVPEELAAKVENAVSDAVESYLLDHLVTEDVSQAEGWRGDIFDLAERFAEAFNGQEKNVGQGRVFEQYIEVTLPDGAKFAIRRREPREKK